MSTQPNTKSNGIAPEGTDGPGEQPTTPKRKRSSHTPAAAKFNVIRPAEVRTRIASQAPPAERERAREPKGVAEPNRLRSGLDTESMPEAVRQRYVQDGRDYYTRGGERAFVDKGSELKTKSENAAIVRDLVAVAAARAWNEVDIGGTKGFRREAWRAAKLAGLEVVGYTPSRVEQALLIDALARRGEKHASRGEEPEASGRRGQHGKTLAPGAREDAPLLTGKLIEHKADHYLHDPEQEMSYYVLLKTRRGQREVWGVDLERAIRQSLTDVQPGDDIGLRAVTRRDFTKRTHKLGENGRRVPIDVEAHRNGWIVEQRRFFDDREVLARTFRNEGIKPREATRKHPELKGSYLELQAGKLRFEQSVKNPEDRAAFLAQLRERMAAAMERGEPLTPVRMRERTAVHGAESPSKTPEIANPGHLFVR